MIEYVDYQILFMGTVWYLGLGTLFVLALAVLITQLKKNLLQIRELKRSQANSSPEKPEPGKTEQDFSQP